MTTTPPAVYRLDGLCAAGLALALQGQDPLDVLGRPDSAEELAITGAILATIRAAVPAIAAAAACDHDDPDDPTGTTMVVVTARWNAALASLTQRAAQAHHLADTVN